MYIKHEHTQRLTSRTLLTLIIIIGIFLSRCCPPIGNLTPDTDLPITRTDNTTRHMPYVFTAWLSVVIRADMSHTLLIEFHTI